MLQAVEQIANSSGRRWPILVYQRRRRRGANGAGTVRRLCCDGSVVALVENTNSQPMSVGRSRRTVTPSMRKALFARDRTCTLPGCHHGRYIDAHHVIHWAKGGETSLKNLVPLCSHHHTLIHEGGFGMRLHRDGSHYFVRPDGRPVEVRHRELVSSSAEDGIG